MITIKHSRHFGAMVKQYDSRKQRLLSRRQAMYYAGKLPPRYPMPTIIAGAYVIGVALADDCSLLVVWFADGEISAI